MVDGNREDVDDDDGDDDVGDDVDGDGVRALAFHLRPAAVVATAKEVRAMCTIKIVKLF